jgi:hypothetical protein
MIMDVSCIKLNRFLCTQLKYCADETGTDSEWTDTFHAVHDNESDTLCFSNTDAPVEPDNRMSRELDDQLYVGAPGTTSAATPSETQTERSAESDIASSEAACSAPDSDVAAAAEDSDTADSSARSIIGSGTFVQVIRSMISMSGETAADSIMDDIDSIGDTMNTSE